MQHDGTQLQLAGSPVWVQHAAALSRPGHPSPNVPQDDQLRGKLILLVIEGRPGRWRLLHRLRQVGLRLACYTNTAGPGWAEKYIPSEQWVSGPLDDAAEAVRRVRQWQAQDPAGRVFDGILCYDEFGVEVRLPAGLRAQASASLAQKQPVRSFVREACLVCPVIAAHSRYRGEPKPALHAPVRGGLNTLQACLQVCSFNHSRLHIHRFADIDPVTQTDEMHGC